MKKIGVPYKKKEDKTWIVNFILLMILYHLIILKVLVF